MKSIAFYNVKGGVGKTSSSINIAYNLASIYNKRTLLVDLDPQSNATDFFDRYGTKYTVEDLMTITDKQMSAKDVIVHTNYNNLDICPASLTLGRAEKVIMSNPNVPQQKLLSMAFQEIENDYDYCIIDCSPSADSLINTNGLVVADCVYVPLKADKWATRGLDATINVIHTISKYNNSNLTFKGCFTCQWENKIVNNFQYEQLKSDLGSKMLDIKIRKNKSVEEITYAGIPLEIYDTTGKATEDYRNLTEFIVNNF